MLSFLKSGTVLAAGLLLALQLPAADIVVEKQVDAYKLVKVSTKTEGKGYAWFVTHNGDFIETFAGSRASEMVFVGPPGKYNIMLVVATDAGSLDQGSAAVVIGKAIPAPNVDPDPAPDVDPDVPVPPKPLKVDPPSAAVQAAVAPIVTLCKGKKCEPITNFYLALKDSLAADTKVKTNGQFAALHETAAANFAKTATFTPVPGLAAAINTSLVSVLGLDDGALDKVKVLDALQGIAWATNGGK